MNYYEIEDSFDKNIINQTDAEWIARVNAMDYQYKALAEEALKGDSDGGEDFTHWMPLPTPPEGE